MSHSVSMQLVATLLYALALSKSILLTYIYLSQCILFSIYIYLNSVMLSPSSSPPSSPLSHPTAQPSSAFPVQWRSGRTTQQSHSLRPSSASPVQQRRSFLPAAQPSPTSLSTSRPPLSPATVVYLLSPAAPSSSPPSSPLSHPAAQRSYHPTVQPSSTSFPPNSTALLHLFA